MALEVAAQTLMLPSSEQPDSDHFNAPSQQLLLIEALFVDVHLDEELEFTAG